MPPHNPEFVRHQLRIRRPSRRTLDQRFAVRFPRQTARSLRLIAGLRLHSRLRRAAWVRGWQMTAEAYNRRDLDAVVVGFHPDIEYRPAESWVQAGFFEPVYHGPEGYRRYVAITAEVFGTEVYFEPFELIDLGDRQVVLAKTPMRAQASGVPLTESFAYLATIEDGLVVRLQEYYDHREALEAVGLGEAHGGDGRAPAATG